MIEYAPRIPEDISYDQAFLHCITLTHDNTKNWRLPTFDEVARSPELMLANCWFEGRMTEHLWQCTPVRDKDA